jgi:hypothetical protein
MKKETFEDRWKKVKEIQESNPTILFEEALEEVEGFKQLAEDEQEVYLDELIQLSTIYKWDASKMPKGSFFGILNK